MGDEPITHQVVIVIDGQSMFEANCCASCAAAIQGIYLGPPGTWIMLGQPPAAIKGQVCEHGQDVPEAPFTLQRIEPSRMIRLVPPGQGGSDGQASQASAGQD